MRQNYIIIFFFTILLSSCSSLLYYPSRNLYVPPSEIHLSPEEVWLPVEKDIQLFAWYFHTRQSNSNTAPKAVFIQFHGNAENISAHYMNLVWVLNQGYDLFTFDYRGYGRSSDVKPNPQNTVEDGIKAIRWVHQKYPNLPIVIVGQSIGGAIALRAAYELRKEIPILLIVADSTFLSYKEAGSSVLSHSWLTWPFQWLSYLVLSDSYAPGNHVAELAPTPLLVIHGSKDQVIDFKLGEEIFAIAKEPKEFWKVENGRHIDVFSRPDFQKRLLTKLDELQKSKRQFFSPRTR